MTKVTHSYFHHTSSKQATFTSDLSPHNEGCTVGVYSIAYEETHVKCKLDLDKAPGNRLRSIGPGSSNAYQMQSSIKMKEGGPEKAANSSVD